MLLAALAPLAGVPALAAESVPLPFEAGQAVRVIQGYNGGSHQGPSQFGLDLVLADGETSGAPVLSPLAGSVAWAFEPGERTGCLSVAGTEGRFSVMLCHVLLDRPFQRGEKVARAQRLGTVGAAGTVGNNGTAHVHLELHRAGRGSSPVPFSLPEGMPLEGQDLPATGAPNEHGGSAPLQSTNSPVVAAATAPPAARGAPASASGTRCAPGGSPRYVAGFADLKAQVGAAMGEPLTCEFPDPNGTGDVHQQTTTGLAFWRKRTNTPTFTNGWEHWGRTPAGWVAWLGDSIDPPA